MSGNIFRFDVSRSHVVHCSNCYLPPTMLTPRSWLWQIRFAVSTKWSTWQAPKPRVIGDLDIVGQAKTDTEIWVWTHSWSERWCKSDPAWRRLSRVPGRTLNSSLVFSLLGHPPLGFWLDRPAAPRVEVTTDSDPASFAFLGVGSIQENLNS